MNSNQSSSIGLNDFWAKAHLHLKRVYNPWCNTSSKSNKLQEKCVSIV